MKPSAFTGISFIICHRKGEDLGVTLLSIENSFSAMCLSCPYEVITVQGNHPTLQRNATVSYARYSHIYFLDNDSEVDSSSMEHLVKVLTSEEKVLYPHFGGDIIGGPSLLHRNANYFEQCADGLLSCRWVVGRRNARYSQVGVVRKTNSRELILCNMVLRKDFFTNIGGFNPRLYPNEENEIIVRALEQGAEVYYDPELVVYRGQRKDFLAFIKQMLAYGRGRGEELCIWLQRKHSRAWLVGYKIFSFLLLVIVITIFSATLLSAFENQFPLGVTRVTQNFIPTNLFVTLSPVLVAGAKVGEQLGFWYLIYLAWVWVKIIVTKKRFLHHLPLLVVSCHFFYLYGFLKASWIGKFAVDAKRLWFWLSSTSKS